MLAVVLLVCGCATWSVTLRGRHGLCPLENRVLRRYYNITETDCFQVSDFRCFIVLLASKQSVGRKVLKAVNVMSVDF